MKKYYEELEVSQTASKEVIEKAYKVLAKKYHPDTTEEPDKKAAEERFKKISEAYEILSNDEKRKAYDLELEQSNPSISYEDYQNMMAQRDHLNNAYQNLQNELNHMKNTASSSIQRNPNQYQSQNQAYQPHQKQSTYSHQNPFEPQRRNQYQSNTTSNTRTNPSSQKRTYYYMDTGEPASAWAYYKYKIKNFFTNIGLIILAIVALLLMLNAFTSFDIFSLFLRK